ncbi:MAG: glycine cleavage T C-terminal barrel domain-containing protein [Planctomycetota bacterium]
MLQSPMQAEFAASDALMIPYQSGEISVDVVGAFEEVGIEYAAIRKACVLFDMPHTATIEVRGSERMDFLNNMVTQRVADLQAGSSRRSFWLNRKGRVEADMRLTALESSVLIALDRHAAAGTAQSLDGYLFSEDVEIRDVSDSFHRIALHGVGALRVLGAASGSEAAAGLEAGEAMELTLDGVSVIAEREDITGDPGIELCMPREHARAVYGSLMRVDGATPPRQAGWFAVNTARIEAGTPMFNTDFGADNLPMETGVLGSRVDFAKGCYLGQEVVARMHARGVRKRGLVGLRIEADGAGTAPLPSQGDPVLAADDDGTAIGSVTSSTLAPMASGASVAFAMLRDKETAPGTAVILSAEGRRATAIVQESLAFWSRQPSPRA